MTLQDRPLDRYKKLIITKLGIVLPDRNEEARRAACRLLIKVENKWPGTGDVLGKMQLSGFV